MIHQPYKIYKFEVLVKVEHDQNILDAVKKLEAGDWENAD